jgi:hypothetical protein
VGGRGRADYSFRDGADARRTSHLPKEYLMLRLLTAGFALALVALTSGFATAEDKKDEKATAWVREVGDVTLTFEMGKDTAKYTVAFGENAAIITAKLKWDKDTVTSEITDVEIKGNFPNAPKKGEKVKFKWVVKDDVATLSDLTGDNTEGSKDVVEGEYKKKK